MYLGYYIFLLLYVKRYLNIFIINMKILLYIQILYLLKMINTIIRKKNFLVFCNKIKYGIILFIIYDLLVNNFYNKIMFYIKINKYF